MATETQYHGKYKGVIVSKTDIRKLRKDLQQRLSDIKDGIIALMKYIGDKCIEIARTEGSYDNITGNLRSSIGYIILDDGKVVGQSASKQYKGKKGDGSQGIETGEAFLETMKAKFPWGIVLIVCAGMNYAAYVEGIHHKVVLSTAELKAKELFNELWGQFVK